MYVHLGANCLINSEEIIGIFNLKEHKNLYKSFQKNYQGEYEVRDLTENEDYYSCILTDKVIYLSTISAMTLKKRTEAGLLEDIF